MTSANQPSRLSVRVWACCASSICLAVNGGGASSPSGSASTRRPHAGQLWVLTTVGPAPLRCRPQCGQSTRFKVLSDRAAWNSEMVSTGGLRVRRPRLPCQSLRCQNDDCHTDQPSSRGGGVGSLVFGGSG